MTTADTSRADPAPPGRRARKLQQSKEHLLRCAWALFEELGYEAVTMEAIAHAADVARGTLYKHFPAKEALIQQRFQDDLQLRRADARAVAPGLPGIAARFLHVFEIEAAYAESMRAYVAPYLYYRLGRQQLSQNSPERDDFECLIVDLIRQGQREGEVGADASAERMAEYLVFLRLAVLTRWLATPAAPLAPHYAEMIQLFLHGAATRAAPAVPPPISKGIQ
ncbi:TetR/AcrR family transcriptional regulator [Rugamonas rubra]|uniref:Transcriptional regulator, TetR family n=1 Tax=Rugamonas rubra TaxID=758825 RepID=A0A1I4TQX2_9BURK|nr:TetR/AcrR family transcriptional regulator [Rugamonas rubra]SFM79030.1 transcriptional regulator, TetR family [Rugamonas rubra]